MITNTDFTEETIKTAMQDNSDSIQSQKKKHKHFWMIDSEWMDNVHFEDKDYLAELLDHLYTFASTRPVPVYCVWDHNVNDRIYFNIGQHSRWFKVSNDIAPFDFTHKADREFLQMFYPVYKVPVTKYRQPTVDEIRDKVQKGVKFSEASALIPEVGYETGMIDNVYMHDNTFRFKSNGQTSIRMTGRYTGGNVLHLTALDFLTRIRRLQEEKARVDESEWQAIDLEIKNIIFNETEHVKFLDEERPLMIRYKGRMMVNFVKIHLPDLYMDEPELREDDFYAWGRYRMKFETAMLERECLGLIDRYRRERI